MFGGWGLAILGNQHFTVCTVSAGYSLFKANTLPIFKKKNFLQTMLMKNFSSMYSNAPARTSLENLEEE